MVCFPVIKLFAAFVLFQKRPYSVQTFIKTYGHRLWSEKGHAVYNFTARVRNDWAILFFFPDDVASISQKTETTCLKTPTSEHFRCIQT